MASRRPSILFEDLQNQQTPNIGVAGDSPRLTNEPTPSWPPAGVIPELNNIWLKPGMYMEPGTGFGSTGASSAIQSRFFPPFFFPFPEFSFGEGVPAQNQLIEPGDESSLANILRAAQGALKGLKGLLPNETPPGGLDATGALEGQFGKEPTFDVMNTSDSPPTLDPGNFNLGTETNLNTGPWGPEGPPTIGPINWGDPSSAIKQLFGNEPNFSLTGAEGAPTLTGDNFNLGLPADFASLSTTSPTSLISPGAATGAAAALAAAPPFFNAIGQEDAARFAGNPAFLGPAGFGITAAATPAAAASAPFTLGASAFALPVFLSMMKQFGGGGRQRRAANDMETLNGLVYGRNVAGALNQVSPELLPFVRGAIGTPNDDLETLKRIAGNHRLPEETYGRVRQFIEQTDPALAGVSQQSTPLQFDESGRALNLPTANPNPPVIPQLSPGEIWRLMGIAAENARRDAWIATGDIHNDR